MQLLRPYTTLLVGAVLGWLILPKIIAKVR